MNIQQLKYLKSLEPDKQTQYLSNLVKLMLDRNKLLLEHEDTKDIDSRIKRFNKLNDYGKYAYTLEAYLLDLENILNLEADIYLLLKKLITKRKELINTRKQLIQTILKL